MRPSVPLLGDVVDVAVLEDLVARLDQVLTLPGVVHPGAFRLRAAAVEVLGELQAVSS